MNIQKQIKEYILVPVACPVGVSRTAYILNQQNILTRGLSGWNWDKLTFKNEKQNSQFKLYRLWTNKKYCLNISLDNRKVYHTKTHLQLKFV